MFQVLPFFIFIATVKSDPWSCPSYKGCKKWWWSFDNWCHDDNNNAECNNFDGGACCPGDDPYPEWDKYCTECKCLQEQKRDDNWSWNALSVLATHPSFTSKSKNWHIGSTKENVDIWSDKKCKKQKKKCFKVLVGL